MEISKDLFIVALVLQFVFMGAIGLLVIKLLWDKRDCASARKREQGICKEIEDELETLRKKMKRKNK